MKRIVGVFSAALISGCGSNKKTEATSCEAVAKRLVEIDAGDKASFLTDKERTSRAGRWLATCEPMSEAARTCVLASTTMEQVDACGKGGSANPETADASAKAAWVMRGGDAAHQDARFVAFTTDGDVIATGDFDGTLDLGGQVVTAQRTDLWVARLTPTGVVRWVKTIGGSGRDYVAGLTLEADGSIVIAVNADENPRFSRVTLTADGNASAKPIATEHKVDAAAVHANGDVVVGSRVSEPVKGGSCVASGFVVQRFAADGKHLWSRCNDGKRAVTLTDDPMRVAAGPDGITAVCDGFSGALAWGDKAAPEGDDHERAFVMTLDAKGEPRWATFVASERSVICDAIAVTNDGDVVAIMLGTAPGSSLALWGPDGTQRWMRSCSELLGAKEACELSALTTSGADVVVAAQVGARTVIATIDGKTGDKKQARSFDEGARIDGLAARAGAVVFATGFSGTVNFGMGPVESAGASEGASTDVLIGRL